MSDHTDLKVKFGSKPNEINAAIFLRSLSNIISIIEEINNEIGEGRKLDINVKALEKGSFLVNLGLLSKDIADFMVSTAPLTPTILSTLVDLLNLRQFLGGKKPKDVTKTNDKTTVISSSGDKTTVNTSIYNFHNSNVHFNQAVTDNFEALQADSTIDSFELQDENSKPLISVPKKDFEKMSVKSLEEVEENIRQAELTVRISVVKVVFDQNRKWDFIYQGNKISALITDKEFWSKIDAKSFSKGDSLEVDLTIRQEYDQSVVTYINKEFTITKVRKHHRRPDQTNLDFQQ